MSRIYLHVGVALHLAKFIYFDCLKAPSSIVLHTPGHSRIRSQMMIMMVVMVTSSMMIMVMTLWYDNDDDDDDEYDNDDDDDDE